MNVFVELTEIKNTGCAVRLAESDHGCTSLSCVSGHIALFSVSLSVQDYSYIHFMCPLSRLSDIILEQFLKQHTKTQETLAKICVIPMK